MSPPSMTRRTGPVVGSLPKKPLMRALTSFAALRAFCVDEVDIALCCLGLCAAKKVPDHRERMSGHSRDGRVGMTKVMDADVVKICGSANAPPRALKVCDVLPGKGADDNVVVVGQTGQGSQD